jgi:hypothetical protein
MWATLILWYERIQLGYHYVGYTDIMVLKDTAGISLSGLH